jgi:hypothetical protein
VENIEKILALQCKPTEFETKGTIYKLRQLLEANRPSSEDRA